MSSDDQNIKNLIGNLFSKNSRLSHKYNNFNMEQVWRDTFGNVIADYTSKIIFHKGRLTVYITSSPLKQELNMTKDKVILRLNENLKYKKVEEVVIR